MGSQSKPTTAEAHERALAGIVERAATNGNGLGVAMPAGVVGGRFDVAEPAQEPADQTPEEQVAEAVALDALVHRIGAALVGVSMDHAITALLGLATHYAKAAPPELRAAALERMCLAAEAIGAASSLELLCKGGAAPE